MRILNSLLQEPTWNLCTGRGAAISVMVKPQETSKADEWKLIACSCENLRCF